MARINNLGHVFMYANVRFEQANLLAPIGIAVTPGENLAPARFINPVETRTLPQLAGCERRDRSALQG
jgi:hypothetical protein